MMWRCALYVCFPSERGEVSICSDFQRRGGGRGFDRFIGNSKEVRSNPSNPPSYTPVNSGKKAGINLEDVFYRGSPSLSF